MLPGRSRPLFVMGMHASGTGLLTCALYEAGVTSDPALGRHQEPMVARSINEALLEHAGGNWWQPPSQDALEATLASALPKTRAEHVLRQYVWTPDLRPLRERLSHPRPWVLEDPRLCLTLPWWIDRFPRAKVLWVQRDRDAIVDSLLHRQELGGDASELTADSARALVERYDEAAIRSVKVTGVPFVPVRYEALTSADEAKQRSAWAAVFEYAGVRHGQVFGFIPKTHHAGPNGDGGHKEEASTSGPVAADGPLVSVIVPNYHHARYLDARIRSIVDQTYKNIEILLMDDCSPDNSREVLEGWAARDDRISLLFNDTNSGSPFHQWQKGARWAKGKYLWIAESDDVAELDMLATHVTALEHNDRAVIAYSQSEVIDEEGAHILSWNDHYRGIFGSSLRWEKRFTVSGKEEVAKRMVLTNTIPNASGALIRKSAFDAAGVPETTWKLNGDWLFYARLLQLGDLEFFPRWRNKFRLHRNTQRMRSTKSLDTYFELLALLDIFEAEEWADATMLAAARRQVSKWWTDSMFHVRPNLKNTWDNAQLLAGFARLNPRVGRSILKSFLRECRHQATKRLGIGSAA